VIRDYEQNGPPLQSIAHALRARICDAWQADCPDADCGIESYFRLHVCTLPHPHFEAANFRAAVGQLREKLLSLELHLSEGSTPWAQPLQSLAELPAYAASLWEQIVSASELDAPTFREALARKWCAEIQRELSVASVTQLERVWEEQDASWPVEAKSRVCKCADLADVLAVIMRRTLQNFDRRTARYVHGVRAEHRELLLGAMQGSVQPMLARLLRQFLGESFTGLRLRHRVASYVPTQAVGTLEEPKAALAALPLALSVGSESEVVDAVMMDALQLLVPFRQGGVAAVPVELERGGGAALTATPSSAIPAKVDGKEVGASASPDLSRLLPAECHQEYQAWRAATASSPPPLHNPHPARSDGEPSTALASANDADWTLLEPAPASSGGSLLTEACVAHLTEELREQSTERARRLLCAQGEKHSQAIVRVKKEAKGWAAGGAMVAGGIAWVVGSPLLGAATALTGGLAGGSARATRIVSTPVSWVMGLAQGACESAADAAPRRPDFFDS
jgi:hypothetical protein